MEVVTIRSEEARNRFRDMLDTAVAGGETVIERHGKPTAVIVGYKQWQEERARLRELELLLDVRRVKGQIAAGKMGKTSGDELLRQIMEKRAGATTSPALAD